MRTRIKNSSSADSQLTLPWFSSCNTEVSTRDASEKVTNNEEIQSENNSLQDKSFISKGQPDGMELPVYEPMGDNLLKTSPDSNVMDEAEIRPLPQQLEGRGEVSDYFFSLVEKTDNGFCYAASQEGIITHYEVFKRKINKQFGYISYPGSKSFEIQVWTFISQENALAKFGSLITESTET